MKNAMKKLMSVLLVAVLLISAIPFAASAESQVQVCVKVDGSEVGTVTVTLKGDSATVGNIIKYKAEVQELMSGSNFCHAWIKGMGDAVGKSDLVVNAGETVYLAFYTDLNDCPKCNTTVDDDDNGNKDEEQTPSETPSEPVATEPTVAPVTFVVKVSKTGAANTGDVIYEGSKVPSNGVSCKVGDLLSYCWNSRWTGVYEFDHAWSKSKKATTYNKDTAIAAGDEVHIMLKPVSTSSNSSSSTGSNNSGITNKDNSNQVWLHVYTNGDASTIAKSINLTKTYLMDDNSTNITEVKNYLLTNYYKAKDSSKNVELDGLYLNKGTSGTFPQSYYTDGNKFPTLSDIDDMLDDGYVHISVMLKNVTAKSSTSSTADTSNPKTGDTIYTAMTVMGISAASLAAVMYIYTKKRQAI